MGGLIGVLVSCMYVEFYKNHDYSKQRPLFITPPHKSYPAGRSADGPQLAAHMYIQPAHRQPVQRDAPTRPRQRQYVHAVPTDAGSACRTLRTRLRRRRSVPVDARGS